MEAYEIDELSNDLLEVVKDLGQEMFLVPFDTSTVADSVYKDSKAKLYKEKISFYGLLKESPVNEEGGEAGAKNVALAEVHLITKDLLDSDVIAIDARDLIEIEGERYKITSIHKKAHLTVNKLITRLSVVKG